MLNCPRSLSYSTQQVYEYNQTRALLQYSAMTQTEGGKWPPYRPLAGGTLLSGPSYANMETFCNKKYEEVTYVFYSYNVGMRCCNIFWLG